MTQIKTRETELDLLKICAFFCVVCLHVAAELWFVIPADTWQWQITNAFRGTWGVPVFVMVTGRFLLDPERTVDSKKLGKYFLRAVVAFLVWAAVFEAYRLFVAFPIKNITETNWKWEIVQFVKGEYHLWYLPMLAGLYLVTPFLRRICQDMKLMRWYLLLFFAMESLNRYGVKLPMAGVLLQPVMDNMSFRFTLGYTGYMVLGYYLSKEDIPEKVEWALYIVGVLCLVMAPVANSIYTIHKGEYMSTFSSELTPNMILASAAVYIFFCKRVSKVKFSERAACRISMLAELGFGAYLIHVLFINLVVDVIGVDFQTGNPLLWIPVLTIVFAAASYVCAACIRKIPVIGRLIA